MDRRELLKLFGVGAAVVPILGGVPVAAAESKLIEIPKIEPVEELTIPQGPVDFSQFTKQLGYGVAPQLLKVKFTDSMTGREVLLVANTFVTTFSVERTPIKSGFRVEPVGFASINEKATWKLEGQFLVDAEGTLAHLIEKGGTEK